MTYTVSVTATLLTIGPQPYALVISRPGALTYLPDTFEGTTYVHQYARTYMSSKAKIYVTLLAIATVVFSMLSLVWWFRYRKK